MLLVLVVRHVGDVRGGPMTYAATAAGLDPRRSAGAFVGAPLALLLGVLLVLVDVGQLGTVAG
ncbi:hypothetical protein ACIQH0_37695 [Streptomyces griseus]|uniref:hypothetical protein n=1 Tax=Streptomyces griseus TaxID=1911 RepID=UPI0037F53518